MSTVSIKNIYKRYFHQLIFFVIYFLFFLLEQSHAQCNSIYDRIVSGYHATMAVKTDGKIAVWGENMGFGYVNQLTSMDLAPPGSAIPLMGTVGGGVGGYDQVIVLASDGLYALGYNQGTYGGVLPTTLTTTTNLQKILTPSGGDAISKLPSGIAVADVASIFATNKTLLIVTKNDNVNPNRNGQVWILTQTNQAVEANGGSANTVGSSSWKRVSTAASTPLTNITAARGQVSTLPSSTQYNSAFMALAANGDVYTWGNTTYLGNGTAAAAKLYATKMSLPAEFSSSNIAKMIGVTGGTKNSPYAAKNTYYLLSNSGSLYALGDNSKKQCGDFSTTERTSWVNVKSASTTNFTNINFISVQEHTSGIPCASAITTDGKLYTWGEDDAGMLGKGTGTISSYDPGVASYDPGIASGSSGSAAIFCEMGGHSLMYLKVGSDQFCYVGHKARGSMGDGTNDDLYVTSFDCTTFSIPICGSIPVAPAVNLSTITASAPIIMADGTSTSIITVQLKNSSGVNLTTSGGIVVITTNGGTISTTIDNYNGTYTAILTSPVVASTATLGFSVSGAISIATTPVKFTPLPAPLTPGSITGTVIQCPFTSGQIYSISPVANAATYTWAVPTGWRITAGQGTNTITVAIDSSGQTGNISVFATNITASSNPRVLAVVVPAFNSISLSSAVATDSQSVCIGAGITAIEYTTVGTTNFTVTGLPTGLQAVYASNKITIAGTPTVVGVFNYTISLQGGCGLAAKNGTVSIHSIPTGTVAASNNGIICEGATVLLTATGGDSYQWFFNGNPIAGVVAATYPASVAGVYSVKLISGKGCTYIVQNTPTLVLNKTPIVDFSFDKYCINTPINFTNTSTTNLSGPISLLWDFGDNTTSSVTLPTHSFLIAKTNIVQLTITPTNCPLLAKSVSKNVQIEIPPQGIKYPTVYAVKNTNTQLAARSSGKIYLWTPFTGLNNSLLQSPIFNYTAPSNYVIQITNDAGCIYRDSVNVLIFDQADFLVPKAFSPNSDGHNDKLLIVTPGIEILSYFRIFNRWGNLVFETNNINITWDGTFRGVAQPSEAYSWFAEGISNLGNKIQRNGQTLILR